MTGEEKCREYQLDNYTLTALVESGNVEYQHFQNATGHWVRRLGRKVCALRSWHSVRVAILGQRRRPRPEYRCREDLGTTLSGAWPKSPNCFHTASDPPCVQETRDSW